MYLHTGYQNSILPLGKQYMIMLHMSKFYAPTVTHPIWIQKQVKFHWKMKFQGSTWGNEVMIFETAWITGMYVVACISGQWEWHYGRCTFKKHIKMPCIPITMKKDILTLSLDFKFHSLHTFHTNLYLVYIHFFPSIFTFLINVLMYSAYIILII